MSFHMLVPTAPFYKPAPLFPKSSLTSLVLGISLSPGLQAS